LREAVTSGELCVIEIPIDPSVNVELMRKLHAADRKR